MARHGTSRDLGIVPPTTGTVACRTFTGTEVSVGGQFQGYTLGNIMSALFFDAALKAHPEIPGQMREGRFDTLLGWLQENIYRHGSKYTAGELAQRVTGGTMRIAPYVKYLSEKYRGM
jgi:carboxypeptidase Taq